jgi:universal stress protein A
MKSYKIIITAVDLNSDTDNLTIKHAQKIAHDNDAELYLVHAVESLNTFGGVFGYTALSDVQDEISDEHKKSLLAEAKKHHISAKNVIIQNGAPSMVITEQAKSLNANLIVVGLHERHGLGFLLGSTAKDILSNAPCDVLCVKLPE